MRRRSTMNAEPTEVSNHRPVVAVLIDAFRHDWLSPELTPDLWSLAKSGRRGVLRETLGFPQQPPTLAGIYPKTAGYTHLFWYDPERSPFRWTWWLPGGRGSRGRIARRLIRILSGGKSADPHQIPLRRLPAFRPSNVRLPWERDYLPSPTLFDQLRAARKRWLFIGHPVNNQRVKPMLKALRQRLVGNEAFIWLHFGEVDWTMHEHGPDTPETLACLDRVSKGIAEAFTLVEERCAAVPHALIFGDHGAVAVERTVDVAGTLGRLPLREGDDYVAFLDSTTARFWFPNPAARGPVQTALEKLSDGHWLSDQDLARLHSRHSSRRNWETIWMADAGTLILPNYFQGSEPVIGMHGYLPDVPDNQAAYLVVDRDRPDGDIVDPVPRQMVDVFPTLLDLLRLPVPSSCEGQSLLASKVRTQDGADL